MCSDGQEEFVIGFKKTRLKVDSDHFSATTPHQEDSIETLEENLQELHVCVGSGQGTMINISVGGFLALKTIFISNN